MNVSRLSILSAIFAFLALTSTSCDKQASVEKQKEVNWLVGTWVVDRDETTEKFISGALERFDLNGDSLKDKIAMGLAKRTATTTIAGVISPLDNLEFKFTEDFQYSKEAAGFGGKGIPYKITGRPASNQITITEGGDTRTFTKDGKNIWYNQDIKIGNAKIYLEKKKN